MKNILDLISKIQILQKEIKESDSLYADLNQKLYNMRDEKLEKQEAMKIYFSELETLILSGE